MDREIPVITAVRAILQLWIMLYHAYSGNAYGEKKLIADFGNERFFHCIMERGYLGADGFLLISGWLNA